VKRVDISTFANVLYCRKGAFDDVIYISLLNICEHEQRLQATSGLL